MKLQKYNVVLYDFNPLINSAQYQIALKALDTFGNCQRAVSSLTMHKITDNM